MIMGIVRPLPHLSDQLFLDHLLDFVPEGPAVAWVAVRSLRMGRSLRNRPLDRQHVLRLMETHDEWPPLLVNRADLTVIDGWHRLAAAIELCLDAIAVELFD